jgi:hypothetical protein
MSHRYSRLARVSAAALLAGVTLAPATQGAADGQDPRPHCCFTNPRFVGTCEVEPEKDETCAAILDYLNNPQSQGKAYCNRTNVRGGWKTAPCEPQMKKD